MITQVSALADNCDEWYIEQETIDSEIMTIVTRIWSSDIHIRAVDRKPLREKKKIVSSELKKGCFQKISRLDGIMHLSFPPRWLYFATWITILTLKIYAEIKSLKCKKNLKTRSITRKRCSGLDIITMSFPNHPFRKVYLVKIFSSFLLEN